MVLAGIQVILLTRTGGCSCCSQPVVSLYWWKDKHSLVVALVGAGQVTVPSVWQVEQGDMSGPELLLDSSIRLWVVLPIVFITFFVGIIRHYVTQLLHSDKKVDLEQVSDR